MMVDPTREELRVRMNEVQRAVGSVWRRKPGAPEELGRRWAAFREQLQVLGDGDFAQAVEEVPLDGTAITAFMSRVWNRLAAEEQAA